MSSVCRAGWLAVLCSNKFNVGHYMQSFQANCLIPAMQYIGTFFFYHFIPLSVILTLPWGHKVSTKQNLVASLFSHSFQLFIVKFDMGLKQFRVKILNEKLLFY